MKSFVKLLLSTLLISFFGASTCDDPETKKDDGTQNNIVIINNSQNNTSTKNNTNGQTTNTTQNNLPKNNGTTEYPFKNNPKVAFDTLQLMSYKCYAEGQEKASRMTFFPGGVLKVDDFEGLETAGTWSIQGEKVSVSLPEIPFNETTDFIAIDLDLVATMVFPSTTCGAIVVNKEEFTEQNILFCAVHEFISTVLIEDSEFQFSNTGYVLRRRWEKFLSIPDSLYSTYDGIWKEVDGIIYVVFPRGSGEGDSIRYLTMIPENERYRVKEFTHPSGTDLCEWR